MAGPLVDVRDVERVLTGEIAVTLVKNANLRINKGEFVSITGPSGSGKSSLLYLMGLLDRPTKGDILIDGRPTATLNDDQLAATRLSYIGFVFQFHFLLPEFSALENVMMPMRRLGRLSEKDMHLRAEKILTDLGMQSQMTKLPRQMSGGQCQRVAIARALANDPPLIFADEPTGNLDTASSKTVQDILRQLTATGERSVVAVTHDTVFAAAADRQVRIVDGIIQSS